MVRWYCRSVQFFWFYVKIVMINGKPEGMKDWQNWFSMDIKKG